MKDGGGDGESAGDPIDDDGDGEPVGDLIDESATGTHHALIRS